MICSSCKKQYNSVHNEKKVIIELAMIVEISENKEFVEKRSNHHNQYQIMKIICQQSHAHSNHSHYFSIH